MSAEGLLGYVAAGGLLYASSILIKPKRGLDTGVSPIVAQVTIEEQHRDEVQITEHPIEQGANVADHAFSLPASLIVRYGWSNSPSAANVGQALTNSAKGTVSGVQSLLSGNSSDQVKDIYAKILRLQASRDPFTVYTGKRRYDNMLIKSVAVTTDATTEQALMVTIELRQVLFVRVTTTSVGAPSSAQAAPESTAAPINSGTKVAAPTQRFNAAGGGAGFEALGTGP